MNAGKAQGWSWWVVLAAAAITYAVLSYLDEWISLPLREWSSVVAGGILNLIGYPITRDGTIIATANFRFEVVPACSGSTALRVLLALGVTWCGSHPGLGPIRRAIAILSAVPLAVAVNGLRVAALVAIGDSLLQPVEGLGHEAIGVLTFLLAIGCLYLLGEALAQRRSEAGEQDWDWTRPWLAGLLALILFAPVLVWCVTAWLASPLDHFGWIFLLSGGVAVGWAWRRIRAPGWPLGGGMVLGLALVLVLVGVVIEVYVIQALGMLAVLLSIACWTGGWQRVLACLPFAAAAAVGLPVVGFLLTTRSGLEGPLMSLVLRTVVWGLCLGLGVYLLLRRQVAAAAAPRPLSMGVIALLAAAVAVESALVTGRSVPEPLRFEISWLQGAWVGMPTKTDLVALDLIGRDHIETRAYHDGAGRVVQVIVTSTGGDRHRAHPPEYCMTGAGWTIEEQGPITITVAGVEQPASRLSLQRQDVRQSLVYWFTDGEQTVGSYRGMLTMDTRRRLVGQRSDWALVRVIGAAADVDAFLREFRPVIRAGR